VLTDAEIANELKSLGKKWDAFRIDLGEGYGGSLREWRMVERMDELGTEKLRRHLKGVSTG
jgi:hypothetical protein